MQLIDKLPFPTARCVRCNGTDLPFVDMFGESLTGRLFLCAHCTLEFAHAIEAVPLSANVALTAELRAAQAQVPEADRQAKAVADTERELRQQVATLQDDVATARAKYTVLEKVNAELKTDPAVITRQQLLEQVAAIAKPKRGKS